MIDRPEPEPAPDSQPPQENRAPRAQRLALIRDPARSGTENMAIDQRLLDASASHATLRFYQWNPPALSLGRFQDPLSAPSLPAGADQVRRTTGGGAIYHDTSELTFSLVLSRDRFPWAAKPVRLYATTNRLWRLTLKAMGADVEVADCDDPSAPFLCFDRRERTDLLAKGKKLLGSAQRRTATGVLIHGSLPLAPNPLSGGAISLAEVLDRPVLPEEVIESFLSTLEKHGLAPGIPVRIEPAPKSL